MGLIVESTELIIATDSGIIKARSFRRKVDGERWNKEYMSRIKECLGSQTLDPATAGSTPVLNQRGS